MASVTPATRLTVHLHPLSHITIIIIIIRPSSLHLYLDQRAGVSHTGMKGYSILIDLFEYRVQLQPKGDSSLPPGGFHLQDTISDGRRQNWSDPLDRSLQSELKQNIESLITTPVVMILWGGHSYQKTFSQRVNDHIHISTLDHSRIQARQKACWQFSSVATLCPLNGLKQTGHVLGAGFQSPAPGLVGITSAILQTSRLPESFRNTNILHCLTTTNTGVAHNTDSRYLSTGRL